MDPTKIIAVFLHWLQTNPDIFLQNNAWFDLPSLEKNLAESDDDELFPIAMTISKWCARHELGDTLKHWAMRVDIDDPKLNLQTFLETDNLVMKLRKNVKERYEKIKEEQQKNS
jgi:hypothetical protein